jgi:mono/diheme cytochrome c family protein
MKHIDLNRLALALMLAAGAFSPAHADSVGARVPPLPKYQQECAACHMAYPPGLLPVASWQRLMGGLNKHFGTDASLDDASVREISAWLTPHAGTYKRVSEAPPQDRISQSAWFLRKHNAEEVPAAVWKRAAIGSAANCVACHANAAQGNFSERDIKIPR